MQDLTQGSVSRHLLKTTGFMLLMMVFQTLYVLIDLYWVGRLGTSAVAAVGIAGNLMFMVLAATQSLAFVIGAVFLAIAFTLRLRYSTSQSADPETARLAASYLLWFIPAMALQF